MDKVAIFFKDARSIWLGLLGLFVAAAYAGDSRWVTKEQYSTGQRVTEIRQLNHQTSDLKTRLIYTTDPQQKAMIKALIINKETKIKNIQVQGE